MNWTNACCKSSGLQGLMRKKSARLLASTPSSSRAANWASVFFRGASTRRSAIRSTCRRCGWVKDSDSKLTKLTTSTDRRTILTIGPPCRKQANLVKSTCLFYAGGPFSAAPLARVQEHVHLESEHIL